MNQPTILIPTQLSGSEDFLSQYKGTCIFVTHDRYFLDSIANRIVELSSGVFFHIKGIYRLLINKTERQTVKKLKNKRGKTFYGANLSGLKRGPRARRTKAKSRLDNFL